MPSVDTSSLPVIERLPGWFGRYFHSANFHEQEEVYEVIEGELEITIEDLTQHAGPVVAAIVPANARHSVKALTDGRAIIVDYPVRPGFVPSTGG